MSRKNGQPQNDDFNARRALYPRVQVGCLNRAHRDIVYFEIPAGRKSADCPECGRKAGRG